MSEMSVNDFLGKAEWEGGFYELFQHGLSEKITDDKVQQLWEDYCCQAAALQEIEEELYKTAEHIAEEEDEDEEDD